MTLFRAIDEFENGNWPRAKAISPSTISFIPTKTIEDKDLAWWYVDFLNEGYVRKHHRYPHWSLAFMRAWSKAFFLRKNIKLDKVSKIEEIVGYTIQACRVHIERQFSLGMTWENAMNWKSLPTDKVWVVDHIIPKTSFLESEIKQAFALTNLRPLWNLDNMHKGRRRLHLL